VGLLEIIEVTQDQGTSCERACKVLELNARAVYCSKSERSVRGYGVRPIVVADHALANASKHTRTNIEFLGLELCLSGVGRATGNARTERLIGTLKREEILLEGEYKNESEEGPRWSTNKISTRVRK
jgi:transposase InsO family protein